MLLTIISKKPVPFIFGLVLLLLTGCSQQSTPATDTLLSTTSATPGFKIALMNDSDSSLATSSSQKSTIEIASVSLFINKIEIIVSRDKGAESKAILNLQQNQNIQMNNFAEAFNTELANIQAGENLQIHKIKLLFDENSSYLLLTDGTKCELDKKATDGQNITVDMPDHLVFENSNLKHMELKLDIPHSLIKVNDSECHFRPVIKLKIRHEIVDVNICREYNKHDAHHNAHKNAEKVNHDTDASHNEDSDDDECGKDSSSPTTTVAPPTTTEAPAPTTTTVAPPAPTTTTTTIADIPTTTTEAPVVTSTTIDPIIVNTCASGHGEIFFDPETGNNYWLCF